MNNIASLTHLYCGNNFSEPLQYTLLGILPHGTLHVCSVSFHHTTAVIRVRSPFGVFTKALVQFFALGVVLSCGGYFINLLQGAIS